MKNLSRLGLLTLLALMPLVACSGDTASSSSEVQDSSSNTSYDSSSNDESSSSQSITSNDSSSSSSSSKASSSDVSSSSSSSSSDSSSISSSSQSGSSSSASSSSSSNSSSSAVDSSSSEDDSFPYDTVYYPSVNPSLYGTSFLEALRNDVYKLYSATASYSDLRTILAASDVNPDGSGKLVPFYHEPGDADITAKWDSGSTWNREHVWPNSRGAGETGAGSDPHVIRPTLTSDNSSRGNKFYGNSVSSEYDPYSCASYETARGEASRIIMYCVVRYGSSQGLSLSNNPSDATSAKTMGTLKSLLEWNNTYSVTAMEKSRQAYLDVGDGDDSRNSSKDFGRNPFIDHPEYANYIWDENGIRTSPYGDSSSGGDSSGGGTSEETTYAYEQIFSLDEINGKSLAVVSPFPSNTSSYYSLSNTPSNSSRPWYLAGTSVTVNNGKMNGSPDMFSFFLESDGSYQISSDGDYLNNYISGTHYSIHMGTPSDYDNTSTSWDIEMDSDGACIFKGEYAYMNFTSYGTWSGAKSEPTNPIYLYQAI